MSALYKFVADADAVQFLLDGVTKFTQIPELNDPSELVPNVIVGEVVASRDRLRRNGYSERDLVHLRRQENLLRRLAPQFQAIPAPRTAEEATAIIRSSFYDDIPRLERLLSATALEMSRKVAVFCLSRRYDSLPMWAHYAGNAAGLAVEFRDLDNVFSGDESGVLAQPIPVRYEREHVGVTFDPQSHESLFFAKFQDWSYEQEVRVVLPLAQCRRRRVGAKLLHVYDVPHTCVARVILGWNMTPGKMQAVRTSVRAINPDVEIRQAHFVRGRVEIFDDASPA